MKDDRSPLPAAVWITLAAVGLMLACALAAAVIFAGPLIVARLTNSPVGAPPAAFVEPPPGVAPGPSVRLPTSTPPPPPQATPLPPPSLRTDSDAVLQALQAAEPPPRDRLALAQRFNGLAPEDAGFTPRPQPQPGQVDTFYVSNISARETNTIQARLVYASGDVYAWVQEGLPFSQTALERAIDHFAGETVPLLLTIFGAGRYPPPGEVAAYHILHTDQISPSIAGYYFSPSEYPLAAVPYSNERSMFYVNLRALPPTSARYEAVLAHEFQHLVQHKVDQNEEAWLDEGLAELAAWRAGFGDSIFIDDFLFNPDMQLNNWPYDGATGPHYGAGYLFTRYLHDQFGQNAIQALAAEPRSGTAGVEAMLGTHGSRRSFEQVFADWVIANYLNDPQAVNADGAAGRYAYTDLPLPQPSLAEVVREYPASSAEGRVRQFGTDYIRLTGPGSIAFSFDGADTVPLLPLESFNTDGDPATDDTSIWASVPGDDSSMHLTRAFNLAGVERATLIYDTWFAIEEGWDYAYVTVSADGGTSWDILAAPCSTTANPHGNGYGPGLTGFSADCPDAPESGWLRHELDLSAYAGAQILLRFEMITDDSVHLHGLAVDNIRIPEIDFYDDAEAGDNGWQAEGFVRHQNKLRQVFIVQIITFDAQNRASVQRLNLVAENRGGVVLELGQVPAVIAISGASPYTQLSTSYSWAALDASAAQTP